MVIRETWTNNDVVSAVCVVTNLLVTATLSTSKKISASQHFEHQQKQKLSVSQQFSETNYGSGLSKDVNRQNFLYFFCCCPINCADLRGTAPALLVPASPTSGHTQGSFCIVALPPEVHRKWRQIVGRLPSEGNTALLLSHFGGVQ